MSKFDFILVFFGVTLSALGALLLKLGAVEIQYNKSLNQIIFQILFNWKIITGLIFYFIPALIWIVLLKRIELSFLQPLFSLVYVLTPMFAMIFLGETIPTMKWIGILIIIIGLTVATI